MKRISRFLATVIVTALLITLMACGQAAPAPDTSTNGGVTPASTAPADDSKKVTLRFSWWGSDVRHKTTLVAFDEYSKANPNVTLEGEYSTIDTYYQKLVTQLAGNTAPDVIQVDYPWLTDLSLQGQFFLNLNDYSNIIDLTKFDADYLKGWCYVGDRLEGIPFAQNGYTMMFNKKVVDAAGIDLNEDSLWDWQKLIDEGVKFQQKNPDMVFLHSDIQTLEKNIFKPYVIQTYGGQWINSDYSMPFSKANLVQTYKFMLELQDKKLIQPISETAAFNGKIDQNPVWANGKAAIVIRWASDLISLQNPNVDMGVARLPVINGSKDTAINTKPSMIGVINAKSENPEAAIKFLNWAVNEEDAIKVLKDVRGVPATTNARDILTKNNLINPQLKKATEVAVANAGTPQNGLNDNTEITSISVDVLSQVLFKKVTPEEGADMLIKLVGEKLSTLKK